MYNGTDEQLKELALLNFPELGLKITEKVKSFLDACNVLGISDSVNDANCTTDELAYKKLKIIVMALNEGWIPDWNDNG